MTRDDGGPAFPTLHIPDKSPPAWNGISLRDWFAGMAMPYLPILLETIETETPTSTTTEFRWRNGPEIARLAYDIADAMLTERREEPDG